MFGLPQTTEFNKRIPKQKFYENMAVSPALKRVFVEQIKLIHWRNKIAPATVNIAASQSVDEIEVIEIKLNQQSLDETVLRQIDKVIPYHILFILSCESKVQAWIGYREAAESNGKSMKIARYYHTEWLHPDELALKIDGLNMDAVWDHFIIQIGGIELEQGKSLNEQVETDTLREKLKRDIEKLEKKARSEKQPSKKFQLAQQAKALKEKLKSL